MPCSQILSIAKALPLQLHPNKDLATKLHEQDPDQFTDPNHKPEIAVALSTFEVFAGFKPLGDIQRVFTLPALSPYSPAAPGDTWDNGTLREATRSLLKADDAAVKTIESDLLSTPRPELAAAGPVRPRGRRVGRRARVHELLYIPAPRRHLHPRRRDPRVPIRQHRRVHGEVE